MFYIEIKFPQKFNPKNPLFHFALNAITHILTNF
jgi:hypothetical protein